MIKKSISILLALIMIVSIFTIIPVSASSKEAEEITASSKSIIVYEAGVKFVNDENEQLKEKTPYNPNTAQEVKPCLVDTGKDNSITVYFINTGDWDKVYIYTWSPEIEPWPGVPMTYVRREAATGKEIYSAKVDANIDGIVVNDASGSCYKTVDIKSGIKDGAGWYATELLDSFLYDVSPFEYSLDYMLPSSVTSQYRYSIIEDNNAEITGYSGFETNLIIPNEIDGYTVTKIGAGAFKSNLIESLFIPKSITSIETDRYGFSPFYNCKSLKKVVFEKGTIGIPGCMFDGCYSIEEVEIPDTVTWIGDNSFYLCSSLKEIVFPSSVVSIGDRAFYECKSLKKVQFSPNLYSLGDTAFYGCISLSSIEIPKSLSYIESIYGNGPFNMCSNLKTVSFEKGITVIQDFLFSGCNGIEEIIIPNTVMRIGGNSFYNCTSLKRIIIPSSIKSISDNTFYNLSKDFAAYCPKLIKPTIYFIDNGYGSISTNDNRLTDTVVLNEFSSNFSIASDAKLSVTCNYSIKDTMYKKASNYSIKIHIPDGAMIEEGSLYLDKQLLTDYTEEDDYISVPVTKQSGKITFSLETDSDCKLRTYAILNYRLNNKNDYDIIDVINEDIDLISLSAEDVTPSAKIKVSGIAPVNSNVYIYVDDEKVTTLKANKAGVYGGEITLNNPVSDTTSTIKAVSQGNNGNEISAEKEVRYVENAPELTDFTMSYNGGTYDLMSGQKNSITFVPGDRPFTFTAKYEHPENVDSVYITSTRNQVTKAVKADWNEAKQAYVFNGYFDKNDHSYVPGTISVNYTPVQPEFSFEKAAETEYSAEKFLKGSDNPILAAYQGNLKECLEDFRSDDKKFSGVVKLTDVNTYFDFDIMTDIIPSYLDPEHAEKYGYEAVEDDTGMKIYMKIAENMDDKLEGEIADFVTGKITKFAIDGGYISESSVDGYFAFTKAMGYMDKLIKWDNTRTDINELKQRIMTSDMTSEERAAALNKMDIASKANNGAVAVMALNVVMAAAGIAIPFPASLILPMIAMNNKHLVDSALGDCAFLNNGYVKSGKAKFNWSIDPSGYVYAGVTSNRVADAKVTAWWIPYDDEDEDFWENPDVSKAEIWDASEYSQFNPLTTDNDGNYAWDVPEGLWKVVVEKDGYETYSTGWLPVPPPQTDVNINLMSKTVPELESTSYADGVITLSFSEYMKPDTLNNTVVKDYRGAVLNYTLDYSKDEKDSDGNILAKEYRLVISDQYTLKYDYYTVSISDAESYSGIKTSDSKAIGEKPDVKLLLGDVDGDGDITIRDTTFMQRQLVLMELPFVFSELVSDVDGDGIITVMDATAIQYYLANMKTSYKIGEKIE